MKGQYARPAVAAILAGISTLTAFGQTFDIYDDWSFDAGNNGTFIYGQANTVNPSSPYSLTLFSERQGGGPGTVEYWKFPGAADPNARWNRSGGTQFGVPNDMIAFHPTPQNEMCVIRLNSTWAVTQDVTIDGFFGTGDQGVVDVYVIDQGFGAGITTLFSRVGTGVLENINLSFQLAPGHTIDFLVGSAGDYNFDSTPIDATIVATAVPEPATIAALAGACLAFLRRRRK
jgi:hypothetical protein